VAKILVLHTDKGKMPKLNELQLRHFHVNAGEAMRRDSKLKLNGVYVDKDGVGISDWEAKDAKAVEKVMKEFLDFIPYDKIVKVEPLPLEL